MVAFAVDGGGRVVAGVSSYPEDLSESGLSCWCGRSLIGSTAEDRQTTDKKEPYKGNPTLEYMEPEHAPTQTPGGLRRQLAIL